MSKRQINKYSLLFPFRMTWTLITFGSFDISSSRASINQVGAEGGGVHKLTRTRVCEGVRQGEKERESNPRCGCWFISSPLSREKALMSLLPSFSIIVPPKISIPQNTNTHTPLSFPLVSICQNFFSYCLSVCLLGFKIFCFAGLLSRIVIYQCFVGLYCVWFQHTDDVLWTR